MDRLNCRIVRDLLPLVVDEVASEESRKMVEDHLLECESCRACRDGLTAQITRTAPSDADANVIRTFQKVSRRMRVRKIVTVSAVILLVLALAVIGCMVIYTKAQPGAPMPIENAKTSLVRTADGDVLLRLEMREGCKWYESFSVRWVNGQYYIIPRMPEWPWAAKGNAQAVQTQDMSDELRWEDGKLIVRQTEWDVVYDEALEMHVDKITVHKTPVDYVYWGDWDNFVMIYDAENDALSLFE